MTQKQRLTEEEKNILKKFGMGKKQIDFLNVYAEKEELEKILNIAKNHNAKMINLKNKLRIEATKQKKEDRRIIAQAKCNSGALFLDYLIKRNLINDYKSIIVQNTNTLTDEFQDLLKKIFNELDKVVL